MRCRATSSAPRPMATWRWGNRYDGVLIPAASGNIVGGTVAAALNLSPATAASGLTLPAWGRAGTQSQRI